MVNDEIDHLDCLLLKVVTMQTQTPVKIPARLLDVDAVAEMLGVSARHVFRLADGGRMPRPIKLGGSVRWDREAIENWISESCPPVEVRKGKQS
jgi:excisionase family DNA binding protein